MATFTTASTSFADVNFAVNGGGPDSNGKTWGANEVSDGDTVVVPAGSSAWASTLFITKGITLQGATKVSHTGASFGVNTAPNYGVTLNPDNLQTIILDDVPTSTQKGMIQLNINANQVTLSNPFRITGFTFGRSGTVGVGSSNNGEIRLICSDSSAVKYIRVDHNYFNSFPGKCILTDGWTFGCIDNNFFVHTDNAQTLNVNNGSHGGGGQSGDGAWSDFPWFGTDQFFFFEDNTVIGAGTGTTSGVIDANLGGKFVSRYNWSKNAHLHGGHGTETVNRSVRAKELYNNVAVWTIAPGGGVTLRGGTTLRHDDVQTDPGGSIDSNITIYREDAGVQSNIPWGLADGTSVWDKNVTEPDGVTFVDGHAPRVFLTGTVTTGTSTATPPPGSVTFFDSSQDGLWATNKWAGYSVKQTKSSAPSFPKGSHITSSTQSPFSVTYTRYTGADRAPSLAFAAGDTYSISKVLAAMDQCGRGKCDAIHRLSGGVPVLAGGSPGYPHSAAEPCICWNSTSNGSTELKFVNNSGYPTVSIGTTAGNDLINVGTGKTDALAKSIYVAALNGQDYIGPFVHPHPLVSQIANTNQAPSFISLASKTFSTGMAFSFTVQTNGNPTVTSITKTGSFTAGITYVDNGDGTATIASAGQGSSSNDTVTLTATNGVAPNATQSFNLVITTPATKIISPPTNAVFGNVLIGTTVNIQKTIKNLGNGILTVSGFSNVPTGFTIDWPGGIIQAGLSQIIHITFAPLAVQAYGGTITINSDATSGTSTFSVSGGGVSKPRRRSGKLIEFLLQ